MEVNPSVAASSSLSRLPKAAFPSSTGPVQGGCWARVGAGGWSALYPQALQTLGARWKAGLRGAEVIFQYFSQMGWESERKL